MQINYYCTKKKRSLFKNIYKKTRDVTIIRDRSIDRKGTISQSITSFFLILKSNNDFFLIYLLK